MIYKLLAPLSTVALIVGGQQLKSHTLLAWILIAAGSLIVGFTAIEADKTK